MRRATKNQWEAVESRCNDRGPGFKAHAHGDLATWDGGAMTRYYPLSMSKIAKNAIEIVSFPMKDGDFP